MSGRFLDFPKKHQGENAHRIKKNKKFSKNKKSGKKLKRWGDDRKRKRSEDKNDKSIIKPRKKRKTKSYKSRVRDLTRLLKKDTLNIEVREAKEKELEQLKTELKEHKVKTQNNHRHLRHNTKYGNPKFFDKRKILRKLQQVNSKLGTCTDSKKRVQLEEQKKHILDDLHYIEHFPKHLKYVSVIIARKKNDAQQLKKIESIKQSIKLNEKKQKAEESSSEDEEFSKQLVQKVSAQLKKTNQDEEKNAEEDNKHSTLSDELLQVDDGNAEVENVFMDDFLTVANEDEQDDLEEIAKKAKEIENTKVDKKLTRKERQKAGILEARRLAKLKKQKKLSEDGNNDAS